MSASRFCVVRVTDRTVCGQCNHELASLVYIAACLNCMCELLCVHIFSQVDFIRAEVRHPINLSQWIAVLMLWCIQWLVLWSAADSRYEVARHILSMYPLKCMLSVILLFYYVQSFWLDRKYLCCNLHSIGSRWLKLPCMFSHSTSRMIQALFVTILYF